MSQSNKTCITCKTTQPIINFKKNQSCPSGIGNVCIPCFRISVKNRKKTKNGVISTIYSKQLHSSKKRKHKAPNYTTAELKIWLLNDWLFNLIYNNWVHCGYPTDMKPSIDRINDLLPYTLDNIQIMTWRENNYKGYFTRTLSHC